MAVAPPKRSASERHNGSAKRPPRWALGPTRPTIRKPRFVDGDDYGSPGRSEWLDIDWREHLRSEVVHGARVNYVEIGSGRPLVFIHGLGGCWQNWLENIPRFARDHRVIAIDLPGFGDSELPHEEISIPGYGRFVDAFLGQIGVERGVLAGNSMGGFIAAETSISHPSRVSALVLVSAAGGPTLHEWHEHSGARIARMARLFQPVTAAAVARRTKLVRRRRTREAMLWMLVRHPDAISPELCYEIASGAGKRGFLDALKAVFTYDFCERLPDISQPTLIVWGGNDEIVPASDADEYERLIPSARKVVFEETGHLPMLERPARFNALLDDFLGQ